MTAKLPPEPKVQGQKPVTMSAGDVLHPPSPDSDNHFRIRRVMRERCAALSAENRNEAARRLAHRLSGFLESHQIEKLGSYLPFRNEIDPNGFKLLMGPTAPSIYLPRLMDETLLFVRWEPQTPMAANRFGIPEPVHGPTLTAEECPCLLLPLTAFDPFGRRIGSGGGFYDRTLAFRLGSSPRRSPGPLLIGVGYDCQCIERIDPNPWDVTLDAIVTDRSWYQDGQTFPDLTWERLVAH